MELLTLLGFCAFLFFFGLGDFGLVGADEPRYAQVAREMLARKDWITPVLYGAPWFEKPILYYWEAIIAFKLFGVSDWAARLPGAISATVMVGAVYLFFRRFRSGKPIISSDVDAFVSNHPSRSGSRMCWPKCRLRKRPSLSQSRPPLHRLRFHTRTSAMYSWPPRLRSSS